MKINFKYFFLSCLISLLAFIWIFYGTQSLETVKIEFDSVSQKDFKYAIFWKKNLDSSFSRARYVKQVFSAGTNHVQFFLPTKRVSQFRIDFGKNPGRVEISNLVINGIKSDFSVFKANPHVQDFVPGKEKVVISSDKDDPFIVSGEVNYSSQKHINVRHILWVLFGIYALYMLMEMVFYLKRESTQKRGFFNIEFLRILFTTMVVISHTASFLKMPTAAGGYSVEFFFVLSGFFLVWTFRPDRSIGKIMLKKYLMWTPLIVFGGLLVGGGWRSLEGLLYLQNTGLAAWKDIPNAPAWYLAVLFWGTLFYLCLLKTVKEETRNIIVGCLVFVMTLLIQSTPGGDRAVLVFSLIPVGLLRGFVDMGLGYFLAIYLKQRNIDHNPRPDVIGSIAEIGLFIWIIGSCCIPEWRTGTRIIPPLAMSALIYLFILKRGILSYWLSRSIFVVWAKPCLAVYLTHWVVIRNMLPWFVDKGYAEKYGVLLTIILSISVSWILGIVSYFIIEKPCNRILLRRFVKED